MTTTDPMPPHPFFCDHCDGKAAFKIKGTPIVHDTDCPRYLEDAWAVYDAAKAWCKKTGGTIP